MNAEAVSRKFKDAFLKFAGCHQMYSGPVYLTDSNLVELGTTITCASIS